MSLDDLAAIMAKTLNLRVCYEQMLPEFQKKKNTCLVLVVLCQSLVSCDTVYNKTSKAH